MPRARPLLLLLLAAAIAIAPLLVHGVSSGHDLGFHILSWLDAAQQLRQGNLYPHWTSSAAWNAGEPRFLFYPPLSWYLGALLILILPANATPIAFIAIALTAAGLAFYKLARHFVAPNAALLAATLYLANPYMLFNAFERCALAELLAAAWIPLLLLAVLRDRPTVRGIALPVALLWLTNAPAAVMGCYTFALLALLRCIHTLVVNVRRREISGPSLFAAPYFLFPASLARTYLSGTALGLALPAFYLVPAAWERRYVQVAMAIIPNMRFQDNFLFAHTSDAGHNTVNHTTTLLALTLIALTVLTISALLLRPENKRVIATEAPHPNPVISTEAKRSGEIPAFSSALPTTLALLTALITFLLVPLSTPLWNHLPELAFLQFPWRLLTILAPVLCLSLALLIHPTLINKTASSLLPIPFSLLPVLLLSLTAYHLYAQPTDPDTLPATIAQRLATHHGFPPTDEYTPTAADNDLLRSDDPSFWLAADPNAPAPNTHPTPTELDPTVQNDDTPVPLEQTFSTPTPHHLQVHAPSTGYLVLNLRDYPNWDITATTPNSTNHLHPNHPQRDDGLTALTLPSAGDFVIDIHWHRTWDQNLGLALTILALLCLFIPRP